MNKFIITCGTSQLDCSALEKLSPRARSQFKTRGLEREFKTPSTEIPQGFTTWVNEEIVPACQIIRENGLEALGDKIGTKENPLGAELTTLHLLKYRKVSTQWNPQNDYLVLLSSETGKGKSAAKMIKIMVEHIYEVNPDNIEIDEVQKLTEKPQNIDRTLNNFASQILNHIDLETPFYQHYSLLMSGGFKSVIPCMTLASFLFGIELVYVFEASNQLQSLHPKIDLSTEKERKIWQKTWDQLAEKGLQNQPSYAYTLVRSRQENPQRSY